MTSPDCLSSHGRYATLLVFCLTIGRASLAHSQGAEPTRWLPGYRYRVPVTVENKSDAAQPSGPLLLRFDSMMQILQKKLRADGADLRIVDADGHDLPRYIEGLQDDSEPARIWVRSAGLPANGKAVYTLYYGNPAATAPEDAAAAVFPAGETIVGDAAIKLNFEDLSPGITPVANSEVILPRSVPGYHGRGAWFNGQNAGLALKVKNSDALSNGFSFAFWVKMFPHKYIGPQPFVDVDNRFQVNEREVRAFTEKGLVAVPYTLPYQEWHHIAASTVGNTLKVFVDGKEVGSKPMPGTLVLPRGDVSVGFDQAEAGRFFVPAVIDDFTLLRGAPTNFGGIAPAPAVTNGKEEINPAVPAPAEVAKQPVLIPVEAENFSNVIGRGGAEMYDTLKVSRDPEPKRWFLSYDRNYLSRGYGILTLTSGTTADYTVKIPQDGNYKIWARFAPIGEHEFLKGRQTGSGFQLAAEQNGKTVATGQFGDKIEYDPRQVRWEAMNASLKAGTARLVLTKTAPKPQAGEKIDFFVLTDDPTWVPDYRYFSMVWLRFRILETKNPGPFRAVLKVLRHDGKPWYRAVDFPQYVYAAGKDMGWINGLDYLDDANDATVSLALIDQKKTNQEMGTIELDYAHLPMESAIYKTAKSTSNRSFGFSVLGPAGNPEKADEYNDSVEGVSRRHLAQANAQNWPKDNIPKILSVSATTSIEQYSDETVRNELSTLRRMGMNLMSSGYSGFGGRGQTDIANDLGVDRTLLVFYLNGAGRDARKTSSAFSEKFWTAIENDFNARIKEIRDRSGEDELKKVRWVQLNDEVEAYLRPSLLLAQPESMAAFKKWLDDQKITPASLGLESWDQLKAVPSRGEAKTPEQKRLWMHELDFCTYHTTMVYSRATAMVEKAVGHPVESAINPSPSGFMNRGWAEEDNGLNFFKFWQDGGVAMPWSEDWCYDNGLNYVSAEMASWVASLIRAGGAQTKPTGMYITSGSPQTRRQKMFIALARGAKHVNHYTYGPRFANTEASWSHYPDIFRENGFINADIAKADDLLGPGKQRRGQVAILAPWTTDVWKRNTASIAERFYIYLALVHAQMPVDVLSEEQVAAGGLAGYKTLYVMDDNIRKGAIQQIAKWVNGGGTLVASMAAGTRDEFDAPSESFNTLLGLTGRTVQVTDDGSQFNFQRHGLRRWTDVGELSFNGALGTTKMQAYAMKATAQPKTAQVIGTWADGSPAATLNTSGQGRAIFIGAFPGMSYARGSNMGKETWEITTEYPGDIRDLIVAPNKLAGVSPEVELNVPLVEATLQEAAQGAVVTLVNYTMKPIPEVTMTVRPAKPIKRVLSVQGGKELPFSTTPAGVQVKLPLGMTEFVKLYY